MDDDRQRTIDKIQAALKTTPTEPARVSAERMIQMRRTGYRFAKGDAVIDTTSGQRGVVLSSRPGIAGSDAMYELAFTTGDRGARLDRELEPDATPPTVRGV